MVQTEIVEFETIEILFRLQDYNKKLRLEATNEEQLKQLDKIDNNIIETLKKLYVNC